MILKTNRNDDFGHRKWSEKAGGLVVWNVFALISSRVKKRCLNKKLTLKRHFDIDFNCFRFFVDLIF